MKRKKQKLIAFLSNKKVMRCVDYAILVIASVSFALIAIAGVYTVVLKKVSPIDASKVAFGMMLSLIFCFGLKFLVSEKTRVAIQLILIVLLMLVLSGVVGIARKLLGE